MYTAEEQRAHRRQLCEKLEDGSYKQARRALRHQLNGYCCLGVATEEYRLATGRGEWQGRGGYYWFTAPSGQSTESLVPEVMDYYGFMHATGRYGSGSNSLANDNDHGRDTFPMIAATIRKEPPGLIQFAKEV